MKVVVDPAVIDAEVELVVMFTPSTTNVVLTVTEALFSPKSESFVRTTKLKLPVVLWPTVSRTVAEELADMFFVLSLTEATFAELGLLTVIFTVWFVVSLLDIVIM